MVKLIIDFLGSALSDEILTLNNTILLIPPTCHLPEASNIKFKELNDLDSQLHQGNYIFRTSDDCLRGLVLGKLTEKFPQLLIYSSRPEVLSKYLPDAKIESWPNSFESYKKVEGLTLVGPPALNNYHEAKHHEEVKHQQEVKHHEEVQHHQVALPIQQRNEPKAPQRSSSGERLVGSRILNPSNAPVQSNGFFNNSSSNPFSSQSPGIHSDPAKNMINPAIKSSSPYFLAPKADSSPDYSNFSNPAQSKHFYSSNYPYEEKFPGIIKPNPQEDKLGNSLEELEGRMSEECIKEYLEIVFMKFMDSPEISSVTCYKDLHLLVQRIIREIGQKDAKIIANDLDRFKIQKEACFKILDFGFYIHQSSLTNREVVESQSLNTPLFYSS